MSAIIGFIVSNWKPIAFFAVIAGIVIAIRVYGSNREDEGRRLAAEEWKDTVAVRDQKYAALVTAKTAVESTLTVERENLPPVRWRVRDRAVPDRAAVDSAFQAGVMQGRTCEDQLSIMWPLAYFRIDTTQLTRDLLRVRTTGDVYYDPPTRLWTVDVQAAPSITRTWLIKSGYILPPEVIERDWALEVMAGSSVKNPRLRVNPNLWYSHFGIGADFEPKMSPVYKLGARLQW